MNIFNLSPFVKAQFAQSDELKDYLTHDFNLESDWQQFQQNYQHLDSFALLRKYRQSRLALIAAKDSLNLQAENHLQTLKQTSQLAKLMIQHAYKLALTEFKSKYGTIKNTDKQTQNLIIFALGKLGGNELNYSSDVDLVFCYSDKGQSDGKKCLDGETYFQRLGRRIIQILNSITSDGIVYRVDMRLRPFGSAAPLVCSVANLQDYLQTEGRDWERYAWLRASFVAGDESVASNTLKNIEPFIYRKYLDYNVFESLRQIKAQIARKQQDDSDNLKFGKGGIREIEFIVQTLQLTFAGRNQHLRGNDLWQQMHNLNTQGQLSNQQLKHLSCAWLFLRKCENLCQIIQDRDSHHLPDNPDDLAQCMGFQQANDFLVHLSNHRKQVHTIFENLFLRNKNDNQSKINNPKIQEIKDQISKKNFPRQSKHKIYAAYDAITVLLENYPNSDLIIERYQQIIHAISTRSSYLSMLIESPNILEKLIKHISHSAYFSQTIADSPVLLETLFDSIDSNDFDSEKQWQLFSNKYQMPDLEQYLDRLCQFKKSQQFKAITAYIDGWIDAQTTSQILSHLANKILTLVVKQAHKITQQNLESNIQTDDLIIIAYGSLAMRTMHLNSDFDLVFILNQDIDVNNHKFIMRWIKRIIHLLSIQTYNGSLYQLDTQLRPNGNSGTAVVTQQSFEEYQRHEAWLWEHAALIKSRAVYATETQRRWFKQLRNDILCQTRNPQTVDKELTEMAEKLNQLSHKNHQQEFDFMGNILKNAHKNPEVLKNTISNPQNTKLKLDISIEQPH